VSYDRGGKRGERVRGVKRKKKKRGGNRRVGLRQQLIFPSLPLDDISGSFSHKKKGEKIE